MKGGRHPVGTGRRAALLVLAAALVAGCSAFEAKRSVAAAPYYPRAEAPVSTASVAPRPPPARPVRRTSELANPVAVAAKQPRKTVGCWAVVRPLRTRALAFAAVVRTRARVHVTPGGESLARYDRLNANGVPTVFGVLGQANCGGRWLRVQVPSRPNGVLAWVRARDVQLVRVHTRIEVDLSARRVTLYRSGRELIAATAAVGATDTPTPTGSFYVNQRLVPSHPGGPFGPGAIGVSAFSPVLQDWIQGGPIAIHGTNRPDLLGGAVSHGCVRIRNDLLVRMFRLAVAGTPVVIRA
ncbi:MAG: L,D-transpeptidase [Gaiellaceae bacterium MAG52_C11]|nr:L,D-transpeptidase [Candidatus Gaiellasilicea maunaloa]